MKYEQILPLSDIENRVGKFSRKIIANNTAQFRNKLSDKVPSICMFIWDEMAHRDVIKFPYKITPIVNDNFNNIYKFVTKELKKTPITKAYSESLFQENHEDSFVDLTVANCFPNDLHICDIELSNFNKPVATTDPTIAYRKYHGLGLFSKTLENIKAAAKATKCDRLSLMVAYPPLHALFAAHGFKVSETKMAQTAYAEHGAGYPMILEL